MTTTRCIQVGTTDVSVVIRIIDSADGTPETGVVFNTGGIDLEYRREGAASTDITEATLAALTTAHTDGGFLHIGNGYYRLDLPDAACAAGSTGVLVHGTVTGMVVIGTYIDLVAYNPFDGVRLGLTALPNAAAEAAGGLYTRGTGAGQINQAANGQLDANVVAISGDSTAADNLESYTDGTTPQPVNATQLSGDSTAADNAEAFFDGTGYAGTNNVIPTVTTTTTATNVTTVNGLGAGVITAASIAADAITAAKIADGAIDANTFAAGAINAAAIATDAITAAKIAADAIGASELAADAVTEIQSGLATAAALDTVDNFLDTEIAAIITTLGTPAGASISADIAAIEAQTDDIGTAGAGLTAIPWNAAWDAEVQSEVDDALVAQNLDHLVKIAVDTDFATTVHLNSVVGHLADNGTSATFDRTTDSLEALEGKIDTIDNFIDAEVASILAAVDTEVGAIKTVTDALPNAGALTTIQSDLDDIQTRLPAALVSGRIDASVGAMAADVITASAIASNAITSTKIATDAIGAAQIAADAIGSSELASTAITEIQTGLSTLTAADVNAEVVDVLRTDTIPDSYAADGAQPTFAQAILAIQQFLTEKNVVGTTVTVKKPNGSTSAMTFTLDSATAPTSITRAS